MQGCSKLQEPRDGVTSVASPWAGPQTFSTALPHAQPGLAGEGAARPSPFPGSSSAFSAWPWALEEVAGPEVTAPNLGWCVPHCLGDPLPGLRVSGTRSLGHLGRVTHFCASGHLFVKWAPKGSSPVGLEGTNQWVKSAGNSVGHGVAVTRVLSL